MSQEIAPDIMRIDDGIEVRQPKGRSTKTTTASLFVGSIFTVASLYLFYAVLAPIILVAVFFTCGVLLLGFSGYSAGK